MNKIKNIIGAVTRFSLAATVMIGSLTVISSNALASELSVWWPADNASMSAAQPFKALVDGLPVENYEMYWQVDGGQMNGMSSNYNDYPHKEASVDLTGWKWSKDGSYVIRFVAKDRSGNQLAERTVRIVTNPPPAVPEPSITVTAPSTVMIPSPTPVTVTALVNPVPTPLLQKAEVEPSSVSLEIWWPVDGVAVAADQPFKALAKDVDISKYDMYWQVDGDRLNKMAESRVDAPHKESMVNIDSWTWNGYGPYRVNFVAKNSSGSVIGQKTVTLYNAALSSTRIDSRTDPLPTATVLPPIEPGTPSTPVTRSIQPTPLSGNPLSGISLYVDQNSNAKKQSEVWRKSRPADASEMDKIAAESSAKWLGDWNKDIYADTKAYVDAAASRGQVPVMVAYNIPYRDCGSYSAGGSNGASAYKKWIDDLTRGIGNRDSVVVLEPDALSLVDCLSDAARAERYSLIEYAVDRLKSNEKTEVYVDAGNSNWVNADEMSRRLNFSGIAKADGFALNVSNFYQTADLVNFGDRLSSVVGGKHYVIDTSRNGRGSNGSEWCNPSGRALGERPTTSTGLSLVDAYLWLKTPGESDGACNGGPSAGVWWPEYALGLAQRAAY